MQLVPFLISNLLFSALSATAFLLPNSTTATFAIFSKTALFSTTPNNPTNTDPNTMSATPRWYQKTISITAPSRGCHIITNEVNKAIKDEISTIQVGMMNLFIQHTSASLTINENADPDVKVDLETALNKLVPAKWARDGTFLHTMEGEDDMAGTWMDSGYKQVPGYGVLFHIVFCPFEIIC